MQQWGLNDLAKLLDLLLAASNVRIGDVWLFFDLHHRDSRVNFGRQWQVDLNQ